MRIAVDLTSLADNFSGIERYALNLTLALLAQDEENRYDLIFKNQIHEAFERYKERTYADRIRIHVLKGGNKLLFNQWTLPRFLQKLKADRYIFLAFPIPILLRQKHMVVAIHDLACWDCPGTMKKHMEWYFKLSHLTQVRKAERILTISEFSRQRITEILKVPRDKIDIIYCGLSENFLDPKDYSRAAIAESYHLPEHYILCLSTLEPRKNMELLLQAYTELYRAGEIHTSLVLAGRKGWKIEQMLTEIRANGDIPVTVTGFIRDEDLPAVYSMADCFAFPSIYEGFGIPPLEAMAMETPVLSSDSSCLPEILGEGAVYFKDRDIEDLKKALLRMQSLTAEEKAQRVSEGRRQCEKYRYEREAKELKEILIGDL